MSSRRRPARGDRAADAAVSGASTLEEVSDDGNVVTVHCRFSVMAVRRVIEGLSPEQQEVVRSMGFGGVLHLTCYNLLDRHFSSWLCNQLVVVAPAADAPVLLFLSDCGGANVPITARDVHVVLGIPSGGRRIGRDGPTHTAAVRRALGLGEDAPITLQAAEAVVSRSRGTEKDVGPMTQAERDAFVVAFVLLLVEHFLAPGPPVGRRGKLNEEVFHALANPSEVHLYNWAEYALEELRRCTARARQQVADGVPRIVLSGCLLFLQLFYFDRMNLEATGCGVPRQVQPRVAAYDHASLYQLISLDRQSETEWTEGGLKQFGKLRFVSSMPAQNNNSYSSPKGPQEGMYPADSSVSDFLG